MSNQQSVGLHLAQLGRNAYAAGSAHCLKTQRQNLVKIESTEVVGKSGHERVKKFFRLELIYRKVPRVVVVSTSMDNVADSGFVAEGITLLYLNHNMDKDLVALKISLLGDSQTRKTSFLVKYVGNEMEEESKEQEGLNLMDKTLKGK